MRNCACTCWRTRRTRAQRQFRFPSADDAIEQLTSERLAAVSAQVGACQSVWCGPEQRCKETADAFALGATPVDALRAWSPGAWAGQALASVAENEPEAFEAWRTDPDAAPPGGESLSSLMLRVADWVDGQGAASGRALVIADASVIRAVVVHVLQAPPADLLALRHPATLALGGAARNQPVALAKPRAARLTSTTQSSSAPRRNLIIRADGKTVNVPRRQGHLFVCATGCCCGHTERGHAPVPVELYDDEWERRKWRNRVHLTIGGCLGPCVLSNVTMLMFDGRTLYFQSLNSEPLIMALLDYVDAMLAADAYLPPPPALAELHFTAFRWEDRPDGCAIDDHPARHPPSR